MFFAEEAGCQAHVLSKRRVVRPVSSFLWVRNYWELFPSALGNSYRALRLLVWPVVEAPEGKWGNRRTVEQRRGTLPGVGHACGE
jgi:hypothetical protein